MAIQSGTWKRLPPKDVILDAIKEQRRHNADLTSYLWYLIPVAEEFGEQVYEVAARSLSESGLQVSGTELRELANFLQTPEGQARYAKERELHVFGHVTG